MLLSSASFIKQRSFSFADMSQMVAFQDLGIMGYKAVWDLQEQLLQENLQQKKAHRGLQNHSDLGAPTRHHFLMVEHPPVYTLGKSGDISHVLISDEERTQKNIAFFHTNRGGDITFHGPQQIVGYPILDLEKFYTDIGRYLRNLEEVIIQALAHYGLKGARSKGETGVWLDPDLPGKERKICAMGVRCSRWITMHGFAFNINTDLSYFNHIVPCGIAHKQVTSLEKELGRRIDFEEAKRVVKKSFEEVFEVRLKENQ